MRGNTTYTGRFAPSPSGPLHQGSAVAAVASYLDARAHGGRWLLRLEDLDTPRNVPGATDVILQQLTALGMHWDDDVMVQSARLAAYEAAFESLRGANLVYPCGCTRREIADSVLRLQGLFPEGERPYPGTCRNGVPPGRTALSWRLRVPEGVVRFEDRWVGSVLQDVAQAVGDFVIRRADGVWAYQLAVVVDDAAQGVTHIVRGADLLGSTARQRVLAGILGYPLPSVLHVPLVTDASGQKLSKQNGAAAIDIAQPLAVLDQAWRALGFEPLAARSVGEFWILATRIWGEDPRHANLRGNNFGSYYPR